MDNEDIIGYEADGTPITHKEFIKDIELTLQQLREGTLKTYTSEEVRQIILGT